jgi:hypothetical protein
MAPKERTVTDPVRPCLGHEFEVGNAMTANPRSWVEQGVGGRHSTEVPPEQHNPTGMGRAATSIGFSHERARWQGKIGLRP